MRGAVLLLVALAVQVTAPPPAPASFEDFLAGVRAEALSRGLSDAIVTPALSGLEPLPVVVTRDRAQPEQAQSLEAYLTQRLTARTIATARDKAAEHARLLRQIEDRYGVPGPVMIAIWGLESNFGKFTGSYPTIAALATLAYDGRRPLFREELFHALTIIERKGVPSSELKGSWAGAMGQPQFMPSSFLKHAVDFDQDGDIDIWTSAADVFGSMANYLRSTGWRADERWGREVAVSRAVMARIDEAVPMRSSGCRAVRAMTVPRPLDHWRKLGVTLAGGRPLPTSSISASLVRGQKRHFLVYPGYEAIIDYNCSHSYAISVGLLADKISGK